MTRARVFSGGACLGWILLWSAAGAAQSGTDTLDERDARARATFEEAQGHFAAGEFEAALRGFEQAYELSPRPALLFNIGTTHERLHHNEEALSAFERYLAAVPNAENRSSVLARMDILREAIARERAVEASLAERTRQDEDAGASRRRHRRRVWGAVGGAVGAVGLGVALALLLRPTSPTYEQGTYGVQFTLRSR